MSVELNGSGWYERNDGPSDTGWTWSGWVYWPSVNTFDAVAFINNGAGAERRGLITDGGTPDLDPYSDAAGGFGTALFAPSATTWYFFMIRYTGEITPGSSADGVLRVGYIGDGQTNPSAFTATSEITGLSNTAIDSIALGASDVTGSSAAIIRIGPNKFYSSALSDAAALDDYHYRNAQNASPWAVYHHASGALTTDSSGNGRTLTVDGTGHAHNADEPTAILGDDPSASSIVPIAMNYYRKRRS